MQHTTIRPDWIASADTSADVSDLWAEQMDPERERGEIVTGYFRPVDVPAISTRHEAYVLQGRELLGVSVETPTGTTYLPRAAVERACGWECVMIMEGGQ